MGHHHRHQASNPIVRKNLSMGLIFASSRRAITIVVKNESAKFDDKSKILKISDAKFGISILDNGG
jgi:hypothetical protein